MTSIIAAAGITVLDRSPYSTRQASMSSMKADQSYRVIRERVVSLACRSTMAALRGTHIGGASQYFRRCCHTSGYSDRIWGSLPPYADRVNAAIVDVDASVTPRAISPALCVSPVRSRSPTGQPSRNRPIAFMPGIAGLARRLRDPVDTLSLICRKARSMWRFAPATPTTNWSAEK